MKVKIVGTGSAVPEKCVTNDDLSQWMDTSDEWIRSRTGIETRHLAVRETTTEMAVEAAKRALASAHMDAEELDLIIAATTTPDRLLPNLACEVQSALGACRAVAFDVSAACSGFLYAMDIARHYLEAGGSRRALVIGAETLSRIMDWSDRSTCVLFGDGAGAAVPALVGITDLYDGLFILRLAEHVHAADIRADAAGDAGLAVDDRGHITHFFLIDCEDHGHSLC